MACAYVEAKKRNKCRACRDNSAPLGCGFGTDGSLGKILNKCTWSFHLCCARTFTFQVEGQVRGCRFEGDGTADGGAPGGGPNRFFCPRHEHLGTGMGAGGGGGGGGGYGSGSVAGSRTTCALATAAVAVKEADTNPSHMLPPPLAIIKIPASQQLHPSDTSPSVPKS